MKKILITGASGFLGSKLTSALVEQGNLVRVVARKPIDGYETVDCDLLKHDVPDSAFEDVDTVFHCAALTHDISGSKKLLHRYHQLNVEASVKLAAASLRNKVKSFVFVSSVKAGSVDSGFAARVPPDGIYGKTKRQAELELLELAHGNVMHLSILRPCLIYGVGAKGNLQLINRGIREGWFPPLIEKHRKKSLVHVDDVVRALIFISRDKRANNEIYTITDGQEYSPQDIYVAISEANQKSVPRWGVPRTLLELVSMPFPPFYRKVTKLFQGQVFCSQKLRNLGFECHFSLKDINESIY